VSFSIITPSLNQSKWLRLCVASVADQEGVSVQHLVQDAASTDGTLDWLVQDPRTNVCVQPDSGMYDAINRGLQRAKGEILAYLNCDEQYLPGTLKRVEDFFNQRPGVDILFGNIVIVDENGEYMSHRKVQVPRLYHTWTCHLTTLSCAMFFRRRLIEPGGFFFNTQYRCGGDGEWMVRLLRSGIRMAELGDFTSVFTRTGANLSEGDRARKERRQLRATAPLWIRLGSPLWVAHHRFRRWRAGAYRQQPFEFGLYTSNSPGRRRIQRVERPAFRPPS
jgi:glycosyltransferase involved in cell wall biosynthesis